MRGAGDDVQAEEGELADGVEGSECAFCLDNGADLEGRQSGLEELFFGGFIVLGVELGLGFGVGLYSLLCPVLDGVHPGDMKTRVVLLLSLLFLRLPTGHVNGRTAAIVQGEQPELLKVLFHRHNHPNYLDELNRVVEVEEE